MTYNVFSGTLNPTHFTSTSADWSELRFYNFFYDEDVQVVMYVASQKSQFYMAAVALLTVNILWNLQLDVKTWSLRWFQRFTDTSLNIEVPVVDMVNVIKFVGHGDASALLNDESFTHLVI